MVEYGITTSKSFLWLHVCPKDASIYWYQVSKMRAAMLAYPQVEIASARGHIVKINDHRISWTKPGVGFIHDCEPGFDFFKRWAWDTAENDRDVGAFAEECVELAMKAKLLTLPVRPVKVIKRDEQFDGRDFWCGVDYSIEVKADVRGGVWGTGNLFVQTHELRHNYLERNGHRSSA
jgi:hypothetical protein